ncbi:uncharacterized protein DS421_4g118620 [Arachis hypogaea]|nr:uncharacterized protein DS421_4g118620 [Arachis hypogaea]
MSPLLLLSITDFIDSLLDIICGKPVSSPNLLSQESFSFLLFFFLLFKSLILCANYWVENIKARSMSLMDSKVAERKREMVVKRRLKMEEG